MTDPKKHEMSIIAEEKPATAPMPQKNAEIPSSGGKARHEEHLLDEALKETFPASDPVAENPAVARTDEETILEEEIIQHEEYLLDEALEMTFPASDPIAIPDSGTVAKTVLEQRLPGS